MNFDKFRHAGLFQGTKQAFDDFSRHCKLFYNIDIQIDNHHEDHYWYSFEGLNTEGIRVGKDQAFFERREVMLKEIELFSKQQSKQL